MRTYFNRVMLPGTRDEVTQIVRHYPMCHGPCNQGRSKCPTPEACEIADVAENDADPMASAIFWRLYAVALLLVALMAVLVIVAK